jgi:hypothetical protein
LSHIVREVRVTVDLSERSRIDQIDMPPDEFGKGVLAICRGVAVEQFAIGCHISNDRTRPFRKRTKIRPKTGIFFGREATQDISQGQSPWFRDRVEFRPEGTVEMARNRALKVHRPFGTKPTWSVNQTLRVWLIS